MTTSRLTKLQAAMRDAGLDAVAVVPSANLFYLTGLHLHGHRSIRLTVALVPVEGEPGFVVPALEQGRAEANARVPLRYYSWVDADGPTDALHRCVAELGLAGKRLGVEYAEMRVFELRALEAAAPGLQSADASPLFTALRMVKDADELAAMRRAAQIIEAALGEAIARARVGMTERELAHIWNVAIEAQNSAPAFPPIIASGPNAANPHHANSDRAFQPGDLVVMDGGALWEGYASDITRTIAIGELPAESRRIYEIVKLANEAGRAACRPSASGAQIDRAARDVIEDSGYGAQFLHRTGHGLGLDIHEPPFIVGGNDAPLPVGATFTVEPGVYVAGLTGVRIEDDVVITDQGAESLTTFERNLIVM